VRPQPYDKNKFLQANFRFLVSDAVDLKKYQSDADLMLDWDDVVQVWGSPYKLLHSPSLFCCPLRLLVPCPHILRVHLRDCSWLPWCWDNDILLPVSCAHPLLSIRV